MIFQLRIMHSIWGWLWIAGLFLLLGAGLALGLIPLTMEIWVLITLCFFCELVDSSMGMGYGTSLTPILLLLGYQPLEIVPTVLLTEFASGLAAAFFHSEAGNVNFIRTQMHRGTAMVLSVGSVLGVVLGVNLALQVSKFALQTIIGLVIISAGLFLWLYSSRPMVYRRWKMVVLAVVASFNKALSGGGYGPLVTSGQVLGGLEGRAAVAITSLAESFTCLAAAALYLWKGKTIALELLLPAAAGALLAVPFSAHIVKQIPDRTLKKSIATLAILLGGLTLWKAYN